MGEVIRRVKGGKFLGWYLRWYEGGKRRILASKQASAADARRMLLEIEARVARGEASIPEPIARSLRFEELVARFMVEYSRPRVKDIEAYRVTARVALRRALPIIGRTSADQLTSLDIAKLRDQIARKRAPASVKLTLTFVGTVFSWAMREGLATSNPCKGVERPRTEHSIDFLSREEAETLLTASEAGATGLLGRMLYVAVALALFTGMRKGELYGLRWIDLDLETRRLTVARSYRSLPKSGKVRHLRLPIELVPILREWRKHCPPTPDGAVIPAGRTDKRGKVAGPSTMIGLDTLMKAIGLRVPAHPWHALRHTFASHYVMAGGNILALQKILGHSDLKVTMAYAHLAPSFLDGEMDRVSFKRGFVN